jgi:putative membrane protein
MARRELTATLARQRLALAVKDMESRTGAEIVVAVRRHSGDYAAADLRCGSAAAFATLVALWLLPHPFADAAFVADTTLFFLVGLVASRRSALLRRLFTSARSRSQGVRAAALAAFMDQGVGSLAGRNGVLVYASQLERAVVVLPDVGLDVGPLGAAWGAAVGRLEAALAPRLDLDAFDAALRGLGPLLARILPRSDDDVNELSDDVVME